MMSSISSPNPFEAFESDDDLHWDALPVDSVELSAEQLTLAAQVAQAVTANEGDRQWQAYLLALAVSGFASWLGDRAPELGSNLSSRPDEAFLLQHLRSSPHADVVTQLQVGDFRVCLLAMGSLTDEVITLPSAVLRDTDSAAHFYVLVDVLEEQQQTRIHGYFRHDQWQQWQENSATSQSPAIHIDDEAKQCTVPLEHFTTEGDRLLLDLRVLSPSAIPLSTGVEQETASNAASDSSPAASSLDSLLKQLQTVADRTLNASSWIRNQLDEVAADLSWSLMPELVPVTTGLRSGAIANNNFETQGAISDVFQDLRSSGLEMPTSVQGAYRDLRWGKAAIRLHALVWDIPSPEPEWTLLLVLSAMPDHTLPTGLTLIVQDQDEVLAEREVVEEDEDGSVYAQVIGFQQEMFWVTIDFGNGAIATLPPFAFNPQL